MTVARIQIHIILSDCYTLFLEGVTTSFLKVLLINHIQIHVKKIRQSMDPFQIKKFNAHLTMLLILDGNSEIDAHVMSNL